MTFEQRKFLVLAAWVAIILTIGITLTMDRPALWAVVMAFAIIPSAIGHWLFSGPPVTLAQLIQRGKR